MWSKPIIFQGKHLNQEEQRGLHIPSPRLSPAHVSLSSWEA